jgi:hypothetical protein
VAAPQLGPARLRECRLELARRALGGVAGRDLAPRLADHGRGTADARTISAGGRRQAQCGAISDYLRLDARVARRFEFESAGELTASLEVTNLFNRVNDCCVEYQLEEDELEEIFLDVEATNSIELVPSVGVVWKF